MCVKICFLASLIRQFRSVQVKHLSIQVQFPLLALEFPVYIVRKQFQTLFQNCIDIAGSQLLMAFTFESTHVIQMLCHAFGMRRM